jgi:hypothetical protein
MAVEERKGEARLSSGCLLRCGIDLAARAVDESEERRCQLAAAGGCASTQPASHCRSNLDMFVLAWARRKWGMWTENENEKCR